MIDIDRSIRINININGYSYNEVQYTFMAHVRVALSRSCPPNHLQNVHPLPEKRRKSWLAGGIRSMYDACRVHKYSATFTLEMSLRWDGMQQTYPGYYSKSRKQLF